MRKNFLRRMAFALAGILTISSLGVATPVQAAEETEVVSYTAEQLNLKNRWGADTYPSGELSFGAVYNEFVTALPEAIPFEDIVDVTVKASNQTGPLAIKFYNEVPGGGVDPVDTKYGMNGNTTYSNLSGFQGSLTYIGVMSHDNTGATEYPMVATINGIDITKKKAPDNGGSTNPVADFNLHARWGGAAVEGNTLTFDGQYQEYVAVLPEAVPTSQLEKVTVSIANQGGSLAFKLFETDPTNNGDAAAIKEFYGKNGAASYDLSATEEGNVKYLVFMSHTNGEGDYPFTVDVTGINVVKNQSAGPDNGGAGENPAADLNLHFRWDANTKPASNTLEFGSQYYEYVAALPQAVPLELLNKVTIRVANQTGPVCFKFYAQDPTGVGDDAVAKIDEKFGNDGKTAYEFTNLTGTGSLTHIGIMSHADGGYPMSLDIMGIDIDQKAAEKVYTPTELFHRWTNATTGNTLTYESQYTEYCYNLGEEFDINAIDHFVVKVSNQGAQIAVKLLDVAKEQLYVEYGCVGQNEYTLTPNGTGNVALISFMSMPGSDSGVYPYSVTIDEVTFVMKEGYVAPPEEEEGDENLGENIIVNPNGAENNAEVWSAASGSAKVTVNTVENDVVTGIKSFVAIADRTSNYECISQEIKGKVQSGKTYKVSFYGMLDAQDYAGAPASQRELQLSPMLKAADANTTYSEGINGDLVKTLKPGEWTKFSGTYTPSWSGELESLVLRFLEQGEDYGSGAGVKGKYYITGVTMQLMDTPEASVEEDIPILKTGVTNVMGSNFIMGTSITQGDLNKELVMQLVTKHFNAITIGNELKPDAMFNYSNNTCPGTVTAELNGQTLEVPVLNFTRAEKILDYLYDWNAANPDNIIKVRGHVLVWHSQTPEWFFHEDYDSTKPDVTPEVMALRQEWYIKSVLEHFTGADSKYKDMFYGWDVVNEAVSDGTGTYRNDQENSSWWRVYKSQKFITDAFVFANKYMPAGIELYYNDYNDCTESKVRGIVQLLKDVKATPGARIDGMGMQGHYQTAGYPTAAQFEKAAAAYLEVVDSIQLTELDYKATSAYDGTAKTRDAEFARLAADYRELYASIRRMAAEGANITGITVWGVIDKDSWLQTSNSVGGGANGRQIQCPLLFDDYCHAKEAFYVFATPDVLTPAIKEIVAVQSIDGKYDSANTYAIKNGANASFVPVWDANGVRVKVTVTDATANDTDAVTLYVVDGDEVKSATVTRADATATATGYVAEVKVAVGAANLKSTAEVAMDVVVTDGANSYAYNDTTLNHANSSEYFAKMTLKPCVTVTKATVTVDGTVDAAWAEATTVALEAVRSNPAATATAKILWDKEKLYILAEITDSELNKASANTYEQDSLEIFIDENNAKSGSYEDDDKQYRVNYDNEQSFNGVKCIAENIESATVITETGYRVEASFKWTDITPANGVAVGLNFQINDASAAGSRIGTINWADATDDGWENPSVFGTIVLTGEEEIKPVPTPDPTPEPTPDPTPEPAPVPAPEPAPEKPVEIITVPVKYVVVSGDTLTKIAKKNNMTLAELRALNPDIKNPNKIYVGQEIVIGHTQKAADDKQIVDREYVYYAVKKGDSLAKIARKHKLTLAQLASMNPGLTKQKYIFVGQKVRVQ